MKSIQSSVAFLAAFAFLISCGANQKNTNEDGTPVISQIDSDVRKVELVAPKGKAIAAFADISF